MIQDQNLMKAVSRIRQRSERQEDRQKIIKSFVDNGIVTQLENENNQILYGRRGTGKTHLFQVLKDKFESDNYSVVYIDARTLGSTTQYGDADLSLSKRCLLLFRDILNPIYNKLLESIIDSPSKNANKALELSDQLVNSINSPTTLYSEEQKTITSNTEDIKKSSLNMNASFEKIGIGLSSGSEDKSNFSETVSMRANIEDKIIFPEIHLLLREILKFAEIKLVILLDEWSSLPTEIQPYLAEYLKRSILPVSSLILKIAALEQRSTFRKIDNHVLLGFELGADISISQDLDECYVYDRNPEQISKLYSEMLYNHIIIELEDNYLYEKYKVNFNNFISKLFTADSG